MCFGDAVRVLYKTSSIFSFLVNRRGFTLIELIVVIVIMAILTGAVSVTISDINENTRLSNAATRALADVRYACELAMNNRREVNVLVNVGSDTYEVRWHDDGSYVPSGVDGEDLAVTFGSGDYLDVEITSSGLGGRLSFNEIGEPLINGSPFSNETSVLCLNGKVHVMVYPSGYVKLMKTVGGGGCGC